MAKSKPRVKVPKTAKKNDVIAIKTLISHRMESGHRKHKDTGEKIPRMIINTFTATFNGTKVFSADLEPGVSSNPYLQFTVRLQESGTFEFVWVDDSGAVYKAQRSIEVTG